MANNCDYCHKPLSLMRRLRGEQFCSVEHLDAYTAQQAEFALERLAASVNEKPNTERPPLPKPVARVRPIAAQTEATHKEAGQEAAASSGTIALQERELESAAPAARAADLDYPMAPYLDQSEIEPRELEAAEDHKAVFEQVDHWGKAAQGWSMPPFRSEPSDPRTWNAGKLVAQIPPVAGWRELLRAKAPEKEETSGTPSAGRGLIREGSTLDALATQQAGPVWQTITESAHKGFRLAENRLEPADRLPGHLRTQASSFEWYQVSGAQFPPPSLHHGEVPFTTSGMPELQVALPQATPLRAKTSGAAQSVAGEVPLDPGALEVSLPHPNGWTWTETIQVPKVAMPGISPARLETANAAGAIEAQPVQSTPRTPAASWNGTQLSNGGASFGWESARVQSSYVTPLAQADAAFAVRPPAEWKLQSQTSAGFAWSGPCLSQPKTSPFAPELGTASDIAGRSTWLPSIPFQPGLRLRSRLAPPRRAAVRTTVRPVDLPTSIPAVRTEVRRAGPVKYSPVAIVVMPPPQFALLPAAMTDEQRYVAQVPNGVWRLPRVRHTGYRALGPFPKVPPRVPDQYILAVAPEMAPAAKTLRLGKVEASQDLSGIPQFAPPDAARIHPADYLVWPQPKPLKLAKMLPERSSQQDASSLPIKRFGPGRAGLQSRTRNADGLARA